MGSKKLTRKEKIEQQVIDESQGPQAERPKKKKPRKNGSWFTLKRKLGLLVSLVAILIYSNSIDHGYVLDDASVMKDNWVVKRGIEGIPIILKTGYRYGYWNSVDSVFRPVSLVMFATEWELFPDTPFFYHLINVLVYALTCFLMFVVLSMMYGRINIIIPFAISLLYAAHPIHTEVVANIKSRDVMMTMLFALSALYYMFKYVKSNNIKHAILMGGSYMLSIFSNESSITFLAIVPLILYFYTSVTTKKNMEMSGIFAMAAGLCILTRIAILGGVDGNSTYVALDNFFVDAPNYMVRLATAMKGLGKYFALLTFPHPLTSDYSFNQIPLVGWTNIYALFSTIFFLGAGIFSLVKLKTKNHLVFGFLYFVITVSLFSNIVMLIGVGFGERLMYFPSLGFVIILGHLLAMATKVDYLDESYENIKEVFSKNGKYIGVVAIVISLYSFKTIDRNTAWTNNQTLYSTDIQTSAGSARMHYYHGLEITKVVALAEPDKEKRKAFFLEGISFLEKAVAIYPNYADAYSQIGLTYYRMDDYDKAKEKYLKALEFNSKKPLTYSNLGAIYFNRQQYKEAQEMFEKAIYFDPRFADGYLNLGSVYGTIGENVKSVAAFNKGIEYAPNNASLWHFAAITYQNMGDMENAQKYMARAKQLNPALGN
ncbi:MAG: tetratricopeptide repeat protein [Flavobacteriales bacterium]|nr:tetratricopeptide repeat protein [Flavobacteriales bacterium]